MKTLFFALLVLFSPPSFASFMDDPCKGLDCGESMTEISKDFMEGKGIAELPLLASGACFHYAEGHSKDRAQYAYVFLAQREEKFYFSGSFAFFFEENPYSSLTPATALQRAPKMFEESYPVEMHPEVTYVDLGKSKMIWSYWIRENAKDVLVIGQWGLGHRVFCRFQKHQNQ